MLKYLTRFPSKHRIVFSWICLLAGFGLGGYLIVTSGVFAGGGGAEIVDDAAIADIDPADYRLIQIRAEERWSDNTLDVINVETLQTTSWLTAFNVQVGGQVPLPLDVREMGLREGVTGRVLAILPCPEIRAGPGRIVLTTVNHLNRDVLELTLRTASGAEETLRPNGSHKFYSVSRKAWLSAASLHLGETLSGVHGPVTLVASRSIPSIRRQLELIKTTSALLADRYPVVALPN